MVAGRQNGRYVKVKFTICFFFISKDWQDISENIIEEAGRNVASK